jgi:DNA-binding NtrC family response regulator
MAQAPNRNDPVVLNEAWSLNVSPSGICVMSAAAVCAGVTTRLEFSLPDGVAISADSTAKWGVPLPEAGLQVTGWQFAALSAGAVEALVGYVGGGAPGRTLLMSQALQRLVCTSAPMQKMLVSIQTAAPSRSSVLIQGPRGSGKEFVARALHERSSRASKPFIAVDCGAFQESLLDGELFGSVRGAFSGADADRVGLIGAADGGTLFLDEIGNMSPPLQCRLLRVLSTGELRRVGSHRIERVDVRIIAATNEDLSFLCLETRFRPDLLDRLNTFTVFVPSLCQRREDILPLSEIFLTEAALGSDRTVALSREAEMALLAYPWPGNVRELQSAMEYAYRSSDRALTIEPGHLPEAITRMACRGWADPPQSLYAQVEALERAAISRELANCDGVLRAAAAKLGLSPMTLGRKVRAYGLQPLATHARPESHRSISIDRTTTSSGARTRKASRRQPRA